tara:strand:- start:17475 stop:20063 length:2589 start_codon:yes stop_codon:yes gene_type:complete
MKKFFSTLWLFALVFSTITTAQFTKIDLPVSSGTEQFFQLGNGDAVWGDYDADGDLDIAITGRDNSFLKHLIIYANDGNGNFTVADADTIPGSFLMGFDNSGLAWGDFDNDGDLDLVQNGYDGSNQRRTIVYGNNAGIFSPLLNPVDGTTDFVGSNSFHPLWVDFDHDGDLDLFYGGLNIGNLENSALYRNNGDHTFTRIETAVDGTSDFEGYINGSAAWGDLDNNGYVDLFSQGEAGFQGINSTLYENEGDGTFSLLFRGNGQGSTILTSGGGRIGASDMVDYDADGDLDLFFSGESKGGGRFTALYANNGDGTFSFVANIGGGFRSFTGVLGNGASWGDYDGDGDSDLVYGGSASTNRQVLMYSYDGNNIFTKLFNPLDGSSDFEGISVSSAIYGDYDGDGDLDFLVSGTRSDFTSAVTLYQNTTNHSNTAPAAPSNLGMARTPNGVKLSWDQSSDDATPSLGLNYELRIGTTSGGSEIRAPQSIVTGANEGMRLTPSRGSVQGTWTSMNLPLGTYFWSVQAIDAGHNGSAFATEGTFTVEEFVPNPPNSFSLLYPENEEDTLTVTPAWFSWEQANDDLDDSDSLEYTFELSEDALFTTLLDSITQKGDTTYSTTLTLSEGEYFWRVSVENSAGLITWGSSSDDTPFSFSITPFVPTPPSEFDLLLPMDGDTLTSVPNQFLWSQSLDATDSFFDLQYTFELSNSATFDTKLDSITFSADTAYFSNQISGVGEYYWRVKATNSFNSNTWGSNSDIAPFKFTIIQSTSNEADDKPLSFKLDQNYPNPFNPSTNISYSIPNATFVTIEVFNLLGHKVSTLVNKSQTSGSYITRFDAKDLTSGIYFFRLKAAGVTQTRKMVLIK